ncbi:MAG: helix-turn-helix domain-containing protein [Dechloromonas agitata]|uniref:Helix-turn-helix domain-containing protein n=1 Tax=Dechloromonas agitata TaxID=73030 RepID=A0A930BS01_9RHOO|nr:MULTISPECIES: helix-turn-helix domain-containing protein [Betaproteobacteria]MBF1164529.1 helix-turn-helix domain-containing protein [Dechloromonas agitata]HNA45597.1 helix-turn-helix domain-containing protein [Nitrospira sp.]HNG14491.1 helix-turn-helix domain-containing protein [Accumulibacter sp.]HNH17110.1 helix-turn-helix domain-containing protein [Zoogloea sp.]
MSQEPDNEIGDRLRHWRKRVLGMTQEQFAQATGIHLSAIRKYESRSSLPSGESLLAIAGTGINLHWLLTNEGGMRAPPEAGAQPTQVSPTAELAQRLTAIEGLLGGLDMDKRQAVLNEIFSRVQEAKRVADLEEVVRGLERKVG